MRFARVIFCLIFLCISFTVARAGRDVHFYGEYRIRFTGIKDFPVTDRGDFYGRGTFGHQRLKLGLEGDLAENVKGEVEFYFLEGAGFGDRIQFGSSYWKDIRDKRKWYFFTPRKFMVKVMTPLGLIEAGQMLSSWGMGIVANGGTGELNLWGDAYYGDIVDRLVFVTKPFARTSISFLKENLYAGVGFDVVFRDDFGALTDGDLPVEGILFLLYRNAHVLEAGVYLAYRYQKFDEGDFLSVGAYDAYFRWTIYSGDRLSVGLIGEGAILEGKSDHLKTLNAPSGVHVLGGGGAVRMNVEWKPLGLTFTGEFGGASGDADPLDRKARIFSFDPDYNVGLIAYEEVMAALTASSAERVSNPEIVGRPPSGVELLATNGSVTNSYYYNLNLLLKPLSSLELKFGYLDVWLIAPLSDLYLSTLKGGIPVNAYGKEYPGKHLGKEYDFALYAISLLAPEIQMKLGMEGGIFKAGDALEAPHKNPVSIPDQVYKLEARLTINWK